MAKKLSEGRKAGSGRKPGKAKTLAQGRKVGSGRKKGSISKTLADGRKVGSGRKKGGSKIDGLDTTDILIQHEGDHATIQAHMQHTASPQDMRNNKNIQNATLGENPNSAPFTSILNPDHYTPIAYSSDPQLYQPAYTHNQPNSHGFYSDPMIHHVFPSRSLNSSSESPASSGHVKSLSLLEQHQAQQHFENSKHLSEQIHPAVSNLLSSSEALPHSPPNSIQAPIRAGCSSASSPSGLINSNEYGSNNSHLVHVEKMNLATKHTKE